MNVWDGNHRLAAAIMAGRRHLPVVVGVPLDMSDTMIPAKLRAGLSEPPRPTTLRPFTPMGAHPSGYAMFSPRGRVWFMLTAQDRQPGDAAATQSRLLDTMVAYSDLYRIEGSDWITSVDVAWDLAWVGTEQRRGFELVGDRLRVLTPWRVMPNWAEHGLTRSIVTFQRDPPA